MHCPLQTTQGAHQGRKTTPLCLIELVFLGEKKSPLHTFIHFLLSFSAKYLERVEYIPIFLFLSSHSLNSIALIKFTRDYTLINPSQKHVTQLIPAFSLHLLPKKSLSGLCSYLISLTFSHGTLQSSVLDISHSFPGWPPRYDIKYYPYADNSQLYTTLPDSCPETSDSCNQLPLDISTWMSKMHLLHI